MRSPCCLLLIDLSLLLSYKQPVRTKFSPNEGAPKLKIKRQGLPVIMAGLSLNEENVDYEIL